MPIYEYRCKSCGVVHELEHGYNDPRPTVCPACGGELVRIFHPIGVVFKGSGFHKTDYGGSSGAGTKSAESSTPSPSSDAPSAKPSGNAGGTAAKPASSPPKSDGSSSGSGKSEK